MSERALDWLPDGAFNGEAVKSVLADPVARWSECWFAREAALVSAAHSDPGAIDISPGQNIHIEGAFATAEISGSGKRRLLEAVLDIDLSKQTLCEKDHRVLDALATQVAEDLIARLEKIFGIGNTGCAGPKIGMMIFITDNDALSVTLPRHVLVPMLKARFGNARPPRTAFVNRIEALKPSRITAEGLLGRAELTMGDLNGLSPGDVLVLDKSLHEPVELRLTDSNRHVGAGRLVQNGGQISIQL